MTDNNASQRPSEKSTSTCPACGAELDPDQPYLTCPACSQPLDEEISGLSEDQRKGLVELAAGSNDKLVKAGSDSAEQSFGLGCALGGLIILGSAGVLYLLGIFNIVLAFITLIMGSLAITGIAVLIASFARNRGVTLRYRSSVLPEIDVYLKNNNLSRDQFERVAAATLPNDAPLRSCLLVKMV